MTVAMTAMAIAPVMFTHIDAPIWGDWRVVVLKVKQGSTSAVIKAVEEKWQAMVKNEAPLNYSFVDEEWERQYRQEVRMGGLFTLFTTLSILIICSLIACLLTREDT